MLQTARLRCLISEENNINRYLLQVSSIISRTYLRQVSSIICHTYLLQVSSIICIRIYCIRHSLAVTSSIKHYISSSIEYFIINRNIIYMYMYMYTSVQTEPISCFIPIENNIFTYLNHHSLVDQLLSSTIPYPP